MTSRSSKHNWKTVPLIELIDDARPISYGILKPGPDIENGIPYVRVVDLKDGEVDASHVRRTTTEIAHQYRRSLLKAGDVLMSIRGHVGRCGVVPAILAGANITQDTARLAVNEKCDSRYLLWTLRSPLVQRWMAKHTKGVAVTGINLGDVKKIPIALPPLAEQKRIAATLDQADALRRKRQQALALTDQFLRATFLDFFGDPVTNPKGFSKVLLSEIADRNDGVKCGPFGTQLSKGEFQNEGLPLWGIKHVNRHFRIPTDEFISNSKANLLDGYSLKSGDLVMTRKGTVGNCAIYPEGFPKGIMHSDLLRIRLNLVKCIPSFLSWQLTFSPDIAHQISKLSQGAIMAGINVTKLKLISVLLPPIDLQHRFADVAHKQSALADRQRKMNLAESILFDALVQRAFRGEL